MATKAHVNVGKCWCGYVCGRLPTRETERPRDYSKVRQGR